VTPPRRLSPALMLLLIGLCALSAGWAAWLLSQRDMAARLDQSLILTRRALETEIERFRYLPRVAGEDARIRDVLARPDDPARVQAANLYLESVVRHSGASHLYLLDARGLTLAASNWNMAETFVGSNYSFRPYFRDAMARGQGDFYAIGVTTLTPGYFLSARVDLSGGGQGVLVVKVDLGPLQATWNAAEQDTAVVDADGVVFLASDPAWLYHPLSALSAEAVARLQAEQTYFGMQVETAAPLLRRPGGWISGGDGQSMAIRRADFGPGWQVVAALPVRPALLAALLWAALSALLAATLLGWLKIQRQRRALIALRLHQSTMLERRVAERTEALAHEIEARRKTEADLRATQETLIHAEKMAALGRMSAAIVHEISQPLSAMEATLVTAAMLAETPAPEAVKRIETARNLIRRMQRTTRRLKGFSRKESGQLEVIDLQPVIESALELVQPRARAVGVSPVLQPLAAPCRLRVGRVRLEQVLVNLLLNALDAVEGRGGQVRVEVSQTPAHVCIAVRDDGPGIAPDDLARVAEPFFTTKASGEGLGLGLAISQEILSEFGGSLHIAVPEGGGVVATACLPRIPPEEP